jgi:hypothetical protein
MNRAVGPFRYWAGTLVAVLTLTVSTANATTVMEREMARVASKVAEMVKGLGHDSLMIGAFMGPPQLEASSGPGIAKLLADELDKLDITVKRRAELAVKGEFRSTKTDTGRLAAKIEGSLVDRTGAVLCTFTTEVTGAQELSSLLGLTVDLPADKPERQREEKIAAAIEAPQATVVSTRISASDSSPYALELLIKSGSDYQPRAVMLDEGLAFVKINRGEIYGVRIINDSPLDAAVTLTIDGVNVFAFSDHKDYKHYIIAKKTSPTIKGWHRTNQVSDEFEVGDFSNSATASLLPSGGAIGTITATFAAAWPANEPPPDDELSVGTRGIDATIRGALTSQKFTEIRRLTGRVRSAISVRYTKPDDLPPGEDSH